MSFQVGNQLPLGRSRRHFVSRHGAQFRLTQALDPWQRQVLELRLQGYQLAEIALQTDKSLRTICRAIDQIKQLLQSKAADEART